MNEKQYLELLKRADELAKAYYDNDAPLVSDAEYDTLIQEIKKVEKERPDWVRPASITQKIGGTASTKFQKVTHDVPMLSIEDVFDKDSVKEWVNGVLSKYPDAEFSVETKIDGLSCTLRYEERTGHPGEYVLTLAETRGNGFIGEDVTENVLMIPDVPEIILGSHAVMGEGFQIRGEIYMTHENFERYNKAQEAKGKDPAANCRNLAAGTLRQKDAALVKDRGLSIYIFNVQKVDNGSGMMKDLQDVALDYLSNYIPVVCHRKERSADGVIAAIDAIGETRDTLDYDIDGAVVKINQVKYRDDFTGSSKYTNGHIAYKYPQEDVEVELTDVDVSVGRSGKLTFTGVIRDAKTKLPAQVCGTSVSRVTLHNMDYIHDMSIGVGGVYGLIKSGEVIPMLTKCITPPKALYEAPEVCPCCGSPVTKRSVDYWCDNPDCGTKRLAKLTYFCGRNQMNIEGLSEAKLEELLGMGLITADPVSIYRLAGKLVSKSPFNAIDNEPYHILKRKEGWGEKSVNALREAIIKSKKTTFSRVMVSQQIPGFGHGQVKLLKEAMDDFIRTTPLNDSKDMFDVLEEMAESGYDFQSIDGLGEVLVKNLTNWIETELSPMYPAGGSTGTNLGELLDYLKFISDEDNILKIKEKINTGDKPFEGKIFVCTGSVEQFKNRDELFKWIEEKGGKTSSSISSKSSYLVNNDINSTSGKNKKAKDLGIPIISEVQLLAMAN